MKSRFLRKEDKYADYNKDWISSLWLKKSENHMQRALGQPLKDSDIRFIEEFTLSQL